MNKFDQAVLTAIQTGGPLKAADVVRLIGHQFGTATRRDVNSALYGPLKGCVVKNDSDHTWTAAGVARPRPQRKSNKKVASSRTTKTSKATRSRTKPAPRHATAEALPRLISPTSEQDRLIAFTPEGNLLIRGEAGSGKTSVLAARAGWIASQMSEGSLLFLTYNRALAAHVERVLSALGVQHDVTVSTFHAWARDMAAKLGLKITKWALSARRAEMLPEILNALRIRWGAHRILGLPISFWDDEIQWIYGQGICLREHYQVVQRRGRGTGTQIRREERDIIWDVYETYRRRVDAETCWDVDDPAGLLMTAVQRAGGQVSEAVRYDHVFIDEVQDFDLSWLATVAPAARTSLTMAGDLAQRIYRRQFTWREAGIALPPARSKSLSESFRTTKQIMLVAQHLATNPDLRDDPDYQAPQLPFQSGEPVVRIVRPHRAEVLDAAIQRIRETRIKYPDDSVVVMAPVQKQAYWIGKSLSSEGIPAKVVRGDSIGKAPQLVEVTTCHQAKGLEWDHVFVLGLDDVTIPGQFFRRWTDPADQEEECNFLRRLLYVAMTRARKTLTLGGSEPFSRLFQAVPGDVLSEA